MHLCYSFINDKQIQRCAVLDIQLADSNVNDFMFSYTLYIGAQNKLRDQSLQIQLLAVEADSIISRCDEDTEQHVKGKMDAITNR